MELREYIRLIRKQKAIFITLWVAVVAFSMAWFWAQPVRYDVSVPVEVSRAGTQSTADYQYDQYYRLQADEKFAETVSQWLKDPTVATEILRAADQDPMAASLRSLSKTFRAEKLASSFVQVRFQVSRPAQAQTMTEAIRTILNQRTQAMNQQAQSPDWFVLDVGTPAVLQSRWNGMLFGSAALVGGLLAALFGISVVEYWKEG